MPANDVVAEAEGYDGQFSRDVVTRLATGTNVLAVSARDAHGPAAGLQIRPTGEIGGKVASFEVLSAGHGSC